MPVGNRLHEDVADCGRLDRARKNPPADRIRDELARVQGVGDVSYLGQQDYSMRVWLEPEKPATTASLEVREIEVEVLPEKER